MNKTGLIRKRVSDMKYIHNLNTSNDIKEKVDYLRADKENVTPINVNWLMNTVETLTELLSEKPCDKCGNKAGDSWYSIEKDILCKSCFEQYRDNLE
jgi:formylmethanofuran dehydrogenase subunit E